MNFKKLLKQLEELNLPEDQFVVVSSGSLAVREIRDARDLDLLVTDKLWNELVHKYPSKNEHGVVKIGIGEDIEVLGKGSAFVDSEYASVEEVINSADVINGVRYMNLELLRKFKEKMGRDKDKKDIELIDQYNARQS